MRLVPTAGTSSTPLSAGRGLRCQGQDSCERGSYRPRPQPRILIPGSNIARVVHGSCAGFDGDLCAGFDGDLNARGRGDGRRSNNAISGR